jgi:peptidoglycan/LPS O-acetylase OafA/YrhL
LSPVEPEEKTMTVTATPRSPRASTAVLVAAWAVPVMVAGQFALLAGGPIAVVLVGSRRRRAHRWWAAALAAGYAAALVLWLAGPSGAPSLSKYLSPAATALFAVAGVAVAVALSRRGR